MLEYQISLKERKISGTPRYYQEAKHENKTNKHKQTNIKNAIIKRPKRKVNEKY